MTDKPVDNTVDAPASAWLPGQRGDGRARAVAEIRGAVRPRAVALLAAVLLLQLGLILSYVGAFHTPAPHRIPVSVAAPAPLGAHFADRLGALPGDLLQATAVDSEKAARQRIAQRQDYAALVVDPAGTTDTLLTASAAGPAVQSAVTEILQRVESAQHRQLKVVDIRPYGPGDARGLTPFYLVMGWIIGGYLAAAVLGVTAGTRPANLHRAAIRLTAITVYAALSGLGGAIVVDPVLGALPGHFAALWGIGTLVVLAAGAATMALQILFGLAGIGAAILLFVVLGNPSAGGPYPSPLLPAFWRAVGQWLPTGAGTTTVRNAVYFAGNATTGPLWVLTAYATAGTAISLVAAARRRSAESHVS